MAAKKKNIAQALTMHSLSVDDALRAAMQVPAPKVAKSKKRKRIKPKK